MIQVALLALLAPAFPQWSEAGGGPLNQQSTSAVDGPRTSPQDLWRATFAEILSEPVVSNGVIYVVAKKKRSADLVALDVQTGNEIASSKVDYRDFASIVVREPMIYVTTGKGITILENRGTKLKKGRSVRAKLVTSAAIMPGVAAAHDGENLVFYNLASGKEMMAIDAWQAKPIMQGGGPGSSTGAILTLRLSHKVINPKTDEVLEASYDPTWVIVRGEGLGSRKPSIAQEALGEQHVSLGFDRPIKEICGLSPDNPQRFMLVNAKAPEDGAEAREYYVSRSAYSYWEINSVSTPVVWGDDIYVRLSDRSIQTMETGKAPTVTIGVDSAGNDVEGFVNREQQLVVGEKAPEGSVDGPMTCAGGVLMLGNWAIDIELKQVLWVSQDLQNMGRLIPAADGIVVYDNGEGTLVCAGDDRATGELSASSTGPTVRPTEPGTGDAAILADGRRIEGAPKVDEENGTVEVAQDGESQSFPLEDVSTLELGDMVDVLGDPYGTVHAWSDLLEMSLRENLVGLVELCAKRRLIDRAHGLMEEIETLGLDPSERARLQALLHGKREAKGGTRDVQLGVLEKKEGDVREDVHARSIHGAKWLAEHGLTDEASALLADWRGNWGKQVPEGHAAAIAELVNPWVPEAFPFDDTELWMTWIKGLAPAGGQFQPIDEVKERLPDGSTWLKDTFVIRTENISLITKSEDADTVGRCLRSGEAAIRILHDVLDNQPEGTEEPMDVRLHASRNAFLTEELEGGGRAPQWSAGFYIPSKLVSRFYVGDGDSETEVDRELHLVFAHELTHQYIMERWRAIGDERKPLPKIPGFWVVEGFARFIEDQSAEMGKRGTTLDDPTVRSVEMAAALLEKDALIDTKLILDLNQIGFGALPKSGGIEVTLSKNLGGRIMSETAVFYDQAGALVFFLMNRAGPETRALFIDYMRDYYVAKTKKSGWKALGFDSPDDLDEAFHAFLRSPKSK